MSVPEVEKFLLPMAQCVRQGKLRAEQVGGSCSVDVHTYVHNVLTL